MLYYLIQYLRYAPYCIALEMKEKNYLYLYVDPVDPDPDSDPEPQHWFEESIDLIHFKYII